MGMRRLVSGVRAPCRLRRNRICFARDEKSPVAEGGRLWSKLLILLVGSFGDRRAIIPATFCRGRDKSWDIGSVECSGSSGSGARVGSDASRKAGACGFDGRMIGYGWLSGWRCFCSSSTASWSPAWRAMVMACWPSLASGLLALTVGEQV